MLKITLEEENKTKKSMNGEGNDWVLNLALFFLLRFLFFSTVTHVRSLLRSTALAYIFFFSFFRRNIPK